KLMESLESREDRFNAVINQGAEMRRRGHPAEATVHETAARMEQQWTWFLSLTNCLEHHLEMAVRSGQFFAIAQELNDWTEQAQRQLSSEFLLYEEQGSEEGQALLRSLRSTRDQLLQKSAELEHLNGEAAHLAPVPIKRNQRYLSMTGLDGARTLCSYQHLAQGEPLVLLDSSGPKCLARPREGPPVWLPALCVRLSGPCPEACDAAKKLSLKFQHLEKLLQHRELRLREQLVRSSMTTLLQQSQEELASLSLEHRRAVLDSLNQDAGKLLLDMKVAGIAPLDSQTFHADLDACNDAFFRLARGAGRFADSGRLQEELELLDSKLANFETRMLALTSAGGPNDLASLEAAVTEQDSLESKLSGLEWEMNYLRQRLQQELGVVPDSFQLLERRRGSVWDVAQEQVRRLQAARDFFAQLESVASSLTRVEELLAESRVFPVRESELQRHLASLRNVQQLLESAKSDLEQAEAAAQLSKLTRPAAERWRRLSDVAEQRLALLDHCAGQFDAYMRLAKQFSVWLAGCHRRLQSAPSADANAIVEVGRSAEQAGADLAGLNATGTELIEVARTYDFAGRGGSGSSGSEGGAEQLQEELARLNGDFQKLVALLEHRQQVLQASKHESLSLANASLNNSNVGSSGGSESDYQQLLPKRAILTNTPSPVLDVPNHFAVASPIRHNRDGWSVADFTAADEAVQEAGTSVLVSSERALPLTQLRSPVQLTASTTVSPVSMATVQAAPALVSRRSGPIDRSDLAGGEDPIKLPRSEEQHSLAEWGLGGAETATVPISQGSKSIARPGELSRQPRETSPQQGQSQAAAMAAALAEQQQQQSQHRKRRLSNEDKDESEETLRKQTQKEQQQKQGQQMKALRIDTSPEATSISAAASRPAATAPTLNELLTRGLVDETSGLLVLPLPGAPFTIAEALNRGLIDAQLSTIVDPDTGAQVPLNRAIATGLLNPESGSVRCRSSGQNLTFADAVLEGLLPEETPMAADHMTFEEALSRGFVDYKRNAVELPGRPSVPIDRAIASGWLDPPQSVTSVRSKERRTPTSLTGGSARSATGSKHNADTASEGSELTDVTQLPVTAQASGGPFLDSPAASSSAVTSAAGSELSVLASTLLARRTAAPAASAAPETDPIYSNLSGSKNQSSQPQVQKQQQKQQQTDKPSSSSRTNGAKNKEGDDGRPSGRQLSDISSVSGAGGALERNCVLDMLCLKHGNTKMQGRVTNQMLVSGEVDLESGTLKDPESLQRITIVEAIRKRSAYATVVTVGRGKMYVEQYDSRHHMHEIQGVYDSYNKTRVSVFEALERGLIDPVRATYLDTKTGDVSILTDAMREGQVQTIPLSRAPSSLTHPFDNYHARTVEEELTLEAPRKLPKDVGDSVREPLHQAARSLPKQQEQLTAELLGADRAAVLALDHPGGVLADASSQPQRFRLRSGYELTATGQVKDPSGALISLETAEKMGILTVADAAAAATLAGGDPMSQASNPAASSQQSSSSQTFGDGFPQPDSVPPARPEQLGHMPASLPEAIQPGDTDDELLQRQAQQAQQDQPISSVRMARAGADAFMQPTGSAPQNKFGDRRLGNRYEQQGEDVPMDEEEQIDALHALADELAMSSSQEDVSRPANHQNDFSHPANSSHLGDPDKQENFASQVHRTRAGDLATSGSFSIR
uniref:PH domain-containing protein n=1 Tax=Macrostomum lignano TaxID=282301 RepID=A0A1I8J3L5_9PLAT